jgi:hypothetical protein
VTWQSNGGFTAQDKMFMFFLMLLVVVIAPFGTGVMVLAIWGDAGLASKGITVFASMFTGLLGLGTGYLLGRPSPKGETSK